MFNPDSHLKLDVTVDKSSSATDLLCHHLRLFGMGEFLKQGRVKIVAYPGKSNFSKVRTRVEGGEVAVVLLPQPDFLAELGVTQAQDAAPAERLNSVLSSSNETKTLKTLHPYRTYVHAFGLPMVMAQGGQPVWLWIPAIGGGGFLLIGTDLAGDLLRYRQGDPARAANRPTEAQWGIHGERPNYLFEEQLSGDQANSRHADWWVFTLVEVLADKLGERPPTMLPGGAPGAVVLTGDDDQAYLEKYDEQLKLLGDMPITYLLHPLTRHTQKTLRAMQRRNPGVDFGIHPDALEAPERYGERFDEQVDWYRKLTGNKPVSLRNHGFLNDGYWGHLDAWLKHGVRISSNLPGFDGRVLNGSLLPARLAWQGRLTSHWSVLTAVGDGVRFAAGMTDEEAADRVLAVADQIRQNAIPGVMVLNLHPQNVSETRAMHLAAREVVRSGFVAWNLRQCLEWFEQVDGGMSAKAAGSGRSDNWLSQQWRRFGRLIEPSRRVHLA